MANIGHRPMVFGFETIRFALRLETLTRHHENGLAHAIVL
jgi:hypothetical protein